MRGTKLQLLRKKARLTQPDLGAILGVSANTISRWEAGATAKFSHSCLQAWAEAMHVSLEELMAAIDETVNKSA